MGFNGVLISAVADASVDAWQQILSIRERLSSQQLLEILCCYPLQQLGRFALCLWNFLCLPPPDSYYTYYYSSSESDRLPYRQES
ncbi:hypothetical protein SLEP1_g39108 [Rubroshorea leprosula]|uniref:Uncharacterized protein n=1 Tax=Rubroshorea leprosula TaxID=152421 RepID=A0AAV5KZY0_9ROSI|nr:hypothetical protein SLEP1_g39108 [Rubroshorea leprosula]